MGKNKKLKKQVKKLIRENYGWKDSLFISYKKLNLAADCLKAHRLDYVKETLLQVEQYLMDNECGVKEEHVSLDILLQRINSSKMYVTNMSESMQPDYLKKYMTTNN